MHLISSVFSILSPPFFTCFICEAMIKKRENTRVESWELQQISVLKSRILNAIGLVFQMEHKMVCAFFGEKHCFQLCLNWIFLHKILLLQGVEKEFFSNINSLNLCVTLDSLILPPPPNNFMYFFFHILIHIDCLFLFCC